MNYFTLGLSILAKTIVHFCLNNSIRENIFSLFKNALILVQHMPDYFCLKHPKLLQFANAVDQMRFLILTTSYPSVLSVLCSFYSKYNKAGHFLILQT